MPYALRSFVCVCEPLKEGLIHFLTGHIVIFSFQFLGAFAKIVKYDN